MQKKNAENTYKNFDGLPKDSCYFTLSVLDSKGMVHKLLDSDDKQGEELNQDTRLYILPHYEQDPEDLVQFMMDSKDESIIFGLRLEDIEGEAKLQLT